MIAQYRGVWYAWWCMREGQLYAFYSGVEHFAKRNRMICLGLSWTRPTPKVDTNMDISPEKDALNLSVIQKNIAAKLSEYNL